MGDEFDVLRVPWVPTKYERIRDYIMGESIDSLDIEQLTLLEYASYEYQDTMEARGRQPELPQPKNKGFRFREEAFRSELRTQRREKLAALVRDIVEGSQNIYSICSGNEDPQFLLNCMLRLSYQYKNTRSLIESPTIEPSLLSGAFSAIEALLRNPSQETEGSFRAAIGNIGHDKVQSALQDAMIYMSESSLKIRRQATEFVAKCLLYEADKGCVADLIVSVYKGRQESPIVKVSNEGWKDIVADAKRACFRRLNIESELDNYALSVYLNDYPGTRETKVIEYPYKGKSIGLGVAIALLAHFKNHGINPGLALTGEIKPNSKLVGAVKGFDGTGKAYAACWSGIEKIIVPDDNVNDAEKEIERAYESGAGCNTIVVGVTGLADAEDAVFQSIISPEIDEIVIKEFPFPIARRYQQIPPGVGERKERYVYKTLAAFLQYLSLILISQYVIRDANQEEIRSSELTGWLYDTLGSKMVSGTWGTIFLKIIRHYINIKERNQSALFVPELYDIPEDKYDYLEKTIDRVMKLSHDVIDGNPPATPEEWGDVISEYTEALEIIMDSFPFIRDYQLVQISYKQNEFLRCMGAKVDTEIYEFPSIPDQKLIPGQLYLTRPDYTDYLHLHPLLIFWSQPTDVTDVMMYYESDDEKVKYQQSLKIGFFDSPAYLSEVQNIYDRLKRERDSKPTFDEIEWEGTRERIRELSHIQDFDSSIYLQRSNVMEAANQFLESDKTCMIISGDAGSGKTSFLCSLEEEVREDPNACVWVCPAESLGEHSLDRMLLDMLVQDYEGDESSFLMQIDKKQTFSGRKLIVCIDAINEHSNPKQLLLSLDGCLWHNRNTENGGVKIQR